MQICYLELKDHVAHGFEAVGFFGRGGEAAVATGAGARDLAEESLHEIRDEALVGVAVRGGALVQDPHDALDSRRVFLSDRSSAVQEESLGPGVLRRGAAAARVVAELVILEYRSAGTGGLEVAGVPVQGTARLPRRFKAHFTRRVMMGREEAQLVARVPARFFGWRHDIGHHGLSLSLSPL